MGSCPVVFAMKVLRKYKNKNMALNLHAKRIDKRGSFISHDGTVVGISTRHTALEDGFTLREATAATGSAAAGLGQRTSGSRSKPFSCSCSTSFSKWRHTMSP